MEYHEVVTTNKGVTISNQTKNRLKTKYVTGEQERCFTIKTRSIHKEYF